MPGHEITRSGLRISFRVSIESQDLEPFHSIEQYRVLNPHNIEYRLYRQIVIFFVFFCQKSRILRPTTHIFGSFGAPDSLPPYLGTIRQKNA